MPAPPDARRRWRIEVLAVLACAVAGAVCAAVAHGGVALGAVSLALFCVAGVGGALLVFYEIGRGEDRARDEDTDHGARRSTRHPPSSRR